MKVSLTGTFSVSRSVLEKTLKDAGYEVVNLSKKSDILLVGEKTASAKKIAKAEMIEVRIIREVDPQKILNLLGSRENSYVSMYKRRSDIEAGRTIKVGISNLIEVYTDYTSLVSDEGEWVDDDMKWTLTALTSGSKDVEEEIKEGLGIELPEERIRFLTGFYRLVILDLVWFMLRDFEDEPKEMSVNEVLSDDFYNRLSNFLADEEYDEEDKQELKEVLKEVKKEVEEWRKKERYIGRGRPID